MTREGPELERLRVVWQEATDGGTAGGCPPAATLWAAVRGEAPRTEAHAVVLHAVDCPACASALRLAREVTAEVEPPAATLASGPRRIGTWGMMAAAAAVLLLLALPLLLLRRDLGTPAPTFRDDGDASVQSLLPDDAPVDRDSFILRWSPGPPGTRYSVRLAQQDLSVVASADGLDQAEWLVPAEELVALPPGTVLFWRVVAQPPEGGALVSPMFRVRLR